MSQAQVVTTPDVQQGAAKAFGILDALENATHLPGGFYTSDAVYELV